MPTPAPCLPHTLLIEDDVAWTRLLTVGLEAFSRLDSARTLDTARGFLEDRSYDLVVSDLHLDGSDARSFLSGLRRTSRSPKILLISGDPNLEAIAAECRADAWLAKPVSLKALRETVAGLLEPALSPSTGRTSHAMQIYASDDERIESAASFTAQGLLRGDRAVVLMAERFRDRLTERTRRLAGPAAGAAPLFLPAESVGDQILRDGFPSRTRLRALAQPLLDVPGDRRPLSLYGEIVDVFASRGRHRASIQLERLWNEILPASGARVLCGYAKRGLAGAPCGCLHELEAEHDAAP